MAQSVSCGKFKVGMEWRPICEPGKLGSIMMPLLCRRHCYSYLCCTLQLRGFPLENDIRHPLLKAANTRAVSRGDCWNVGHCVGCVKSVTLGWALETERVFFPLLNPTSLGEEPASDIIRWIFKRTKVPLRFFTVPVWKKLNKNPIQHRYPVWVCVCVCKQHI